MGGSVIDLDIVVYVGMPPYGVGQVFLAGQWIDLSKMFLFSKDFRDIENHS